MATEVRSSVAFRRVALPALLAVLLPLLTAACGDRPEPSGEEVGVTESGVGREPVETRASVDKAVATTGDVIEYRVVVDYDRGYEIFVPEPGAAIAGFRIVDLGDETPRERGDRIVEERWYRLRADLVGSYVLPPIAVGYRPAPADDEAESPTEPGEPAGLATVETSAIFVEVESVLPQGGEAQDIRGLKPLRRVARPVPWGWIGAVAALLVLVGAGWLYLRRRRRISEIPPEPAHIVAFRALDRLRDSDFSDPEEVRRFHFAISEVVRAYVEGRFGLNATDLTTEEILGRLATIAELAEAPRESLERFLFDTDQVKFADRAAGEPEVRATYERALGFVEQTMPRPEPEEAEAPPAEEVAA